MAVRRAKAVAATPPDKSSHRAVNGALSALVSRQLGISSAVLLVTLVVDALTPAGAHLSTRLTPSPSEHLSNSFARCLFLSFRKPGTDLYFKGRDDAFFIGWWVFAFLFIREALMRWVFAPFARWSGSRTDKATVRFAEQAWQLFYYSVSFSVGLYINQTSEYRNLNTLYFWKDYPHDALPWLTKWYYLVSTAFCIQQIIVLNMEARRKDFHQMFTHHIVTVNLVAFSYVLNWTRIGNTILCTMDLADIFLPLAKLFRYTGHFRSADVTFGLFLLSWIVTRHFVLGKIIWSVVTEPQTVLAYDWRSEDGYFFSRNTQIVFTLLLCALQTLVCMWMYFILRVVLKILGGASADDVRSDDEDDDEEEDEAEESDDEEPEEKKKRANGRQNGHLNGNGNRAAAKEKEKERRKDR